MLHRLIACVLLLTAVQGGCALFTNPADTVTLNRGKTFVLAYNLGKVYTTMKVKIEARCASGVLDKPFCAEAAKAHAEFERNVERRLLNKLATPEYATDWDAIIEAVQVVGGIATLLIP